MTTLHSGGNSVRSSCIGVALAMVMACQGRAVLAQAADPALWGVGLGIFDVRQDDGFQAANLNLEWRGESFFWRVRPLGGLGLNSDGAVYGYAGISIDLNITDQIVISPSFAPTIYLEGDSKDLGSWLEFRSGIDLAYRFEDKSRVSVGLYHLSNASTGHDNPGTEILSVYYLRPLPYPFGQERLPPSTSKEGLPAGSPSIVEFGPSGP